MHQRGFFVLTCILTTTNLALGSTYPQSWIRRGECLDENEGPLMVGVKPQINQNVIKAVGNVNTFDACVDECVDDADCKFFTYYKNVITLAERNEMNKTCLLVGFNVGNACFNLENTCVLLKSCLEWNSNCTACQTGMRPIHKPAEEPVTLIMNGHDDNRDWKINNLVQYEELDSTELIKEDGTTCKITKSPSGLTPRFGTSAAFVDDMVINCGGFSKDPDPDNKGGSYLNICEKFTSKADPWVSAGVPALNVARAFAASAVAPGQTLYIMGGYNRVDGFLDSSEKLVSGGTAWTTDTLSTLPEKKSHFCLVMASADKNGDKFLYAIGGWQKKYLKSVHRIKIDDNGVADAAGWLDFPSLNTERSDHACAEVQVDATRKGLMVAGGYRADGAWMSSVEFLNYEKGTWESLVFFPRLTDGRHYHGLTTLGLIPTVFGGWNNGSLSSFEMLKKSETEDNLEWMETELKLLQNREKFGMARVPKSFISTC